MMYNLVRDTGLVLVSGASFVALACIAYVIVHGAYRGVRFCAEAVLQALAAIGRFVSKELNGHRAQNVYLAHLEAERHFADWQEIARLRRLENEVLADMSRRDGPEVVAAYQLATRR